MKQLLIIISTLLLSQSVLAKKELRPRVVKEVSFEYQFYESGRSNYEEDDQIAISSIANNRSYQRAQDNSASMYSEPISKPQKTLCDSIISFAKSQLGKPYRYGTSGPKSFDCSGFTSYVLSHFGLNYGRSSRDQILHGKHVSIQEAQPGDLIFFTGWRNRNQIGHVGIVYNKSEEGALSFIHSSTNQGVIVSSLQSGAYYNRFQGIRRVLPEKAFAATTTASTRKDLFIADLAVLSGTESLESEDPAPATISTTSSSNSQLETTPTPPVATQKREPITQKTPIIEKRVESAPTSSQPAIAPPPITVQKEKKPAPATTDNNNTPVIHTVKKGDTLSSIAVKYRTSVAKLRQANNIKGDMLSLKQKIKIPK